MSVGSLKETKSRRSARTPAGAKKKGGTTGRAPSPPTTKRGAGKSPKVVTPPKGAMKQLELKLAEAQKTRNDMKVGTELKELVDVRMNR